MAMSTFASTLSGTPFGCFFSRGRPHRIKTPLAMATFGEILENLRVLENSMEGGRGRSLRDSVAKRVSCEPY